MGFISRALQRKSSTSDLLRSALYGSVSASGKSVTTKTAVQVSAVYGCCRVIGEGVAQVPLKLMREANGKRLPAKDHPLYNILAIKPNDWQTSFEYRETIIWHLVLTGDHFSFINRSRGKILELIPFEPGQVTVKRNKDYSLTYEVRADNGERQEFPESAIWHIKGPSMNGWLGLKPVELARDAIGLSMAAEESASRLQKNGARPSGVYSVEGTLKDDAYKALSSWIESNIMGSANSGKPLILDRAAKWTNTQMSSIDAQSLETRKFQIEEICRFSRVMPIMIGYSDKATTYASAEQMFLAHLVHTLAPWYQRIEQSIDANLLTEAERDAGLYANFVEEGLLRGSSVDTKDTILGYVNGGILTPNEGRAKLDMNPMDDGESDTLRIPANIVGAIPDPAPAQEATKKAIDDLRIEVKTANRQPDMNINVAAPHIVLPEQKAGDVSVNVEAPHIVLPEQKAGDVTVHPPAVTVHPTEVKAGDVIVNVPPQPPATVTVNTPSKFDMNIKEMPQRETISTVIRNAAGDIIKTEQIERDR